MDKGGIFANTTEQQKIFAKAVGVNQFNDSVGNFSGASLPIWPVGALTGAVPTIGSININGTASGTVTGVGSLRANLKFFATADLDHLPIRSVKIEWGDNTDNVDSGLENYYKNHNDKTCQSSTDATNFANTPNACDSKLFAYSHVYSCVASATCTYTPKITVIDNWGLGQTPVSSPVNITITPAQ